MKIAGLLKTTLIDYPDRIAASLFLAGCNLNCGYCHNRWMIDASRVTEVISKDDFIDWLRTRVNKLDGVCVSGGEPTLSADLPDLLRSIKSLGFAVKLDTNGTRPEVLGALLDEDLVDYVAVDIKAPLNARYSVVAGRPVDPNVIRHTLSLLRAWGGDYELRTTVGPDLDRAALRDIAPEVLPEERWYLQLYVAREGIAERLVGETALGDADLREMEAELRLMTPRVMVRGE
jgi:pyruvate formate lyase activating enzyme